MDPRSLARPNLTAGISYDQVPLTGMAEACSCGNAGIMAVALAVNVLERSAPSPSSTGQTVPR